MRRLIILILLVLLLPVGQAHAYTQAYVYLRANPNGDPDEVNKLQWPLFGRLASLLTSHYSCLSIMDSDGLKESIGFIRAQQLLGTAEEGIEKELSSIADMMDTKYLIYVKITAFKDMSFYGFDIIAQNKKKPKEYPFYTESYTFRSAEAAGNAIENIADHLIKGFTKYLSDEREYKGGEICPLKGPVTVTVDTKRTQKKEDAVSTYCNGSDQQLKKTESVKVETKETWKLERYGIPDTKGTMEGSYLEETEREEFDGCHKCSTGNRTVPWSYSNIIRVTKSVSGLSDKSSADGFENKDAAVRLHFHDDDTYSISVAASSAKGKMHSTSNESAEGSCDVKHKNQTLSGTFTRPFEYTFNGFKGTPYDTKLKEKKELVFEDKDKEEKTTITIDFDLSRPTINK